MWNALDQFFLRGGAGLCAVGLCIGWWALKRRRPPDLGAVVESFLSGQGVMIGVWLVRTGLNRGSLDGVTVEGFGTYLTLAGLVVEWVSVDSIRRLCVRASANS